MAHKLKLISCRSLIAYALTLTLVYLFVSDNTRIELFLTVYTVIITYLFGNKEGDSDK